jgi:hypothetical protein
MSDARKGAVLAPALTISAVFGSRSCCSRGSSSSTRGQVEYFEPALVPWVCGAIVVARALDVVAELLARLRRLTLLSAVADILPGVTVLATVERYARCHHPFASDIPSPSASPVTGGPHGIDASVVVRLARLCGLAARADQAVTARVSAV